VRKKKERESRAFSSKRQKRKRNKALANPLSNLANGVKGGGGGRGVVLRYSPKKEKSTIPWLPGHRGTVLRSFGKEKRSGQEQKGVRGRCSGGEGEEGGESDGLRFSSASAQEKKETQKT